MQNNQKALAAIIMGSDSDLPIMKSAAELFDSFKVPYELTIVSAHRTPKRMARYASQAKKRGIKVILAGAGGSAHLPGMVAALTSLPVIGVPIKTSKLNGLDSLLSIVQMPEGVPVATVAINGAKNAALLACKILALSDKRIENKVVQYKSKMKSQVESKAKKLELEGFRKALSRLQ
ncbi:MAG: 5-(carboxyamino)imidazole ribonucleotide mutase [Elusimicrobia bacterium RIFCSPLOWO2_02_FULL_39_32]|nr:MAG: 5-(carboxyamino)imidazole ribonucleotide mutase [Elusimicrobia bacterium GWA2_38_7]OGR80644.1 MAG: 5-(carboxyamino)imidazole ribonucleotide mutase [Elusimicrobia bacterium RIFCSPHIGHO2_02_FULL_39_36]OGR91493.1 MAG: 5-(carboxyamino)imidazole ribonucleotide mutase [Elusimicrobia bacterium RIFCSPLOWO2_02_FULL_39_32]OGS00748.1 MAG: 5-(carboxyamino)imidazole ribonucleotide mutase [Elusimicrobia bacterium RIFCSPLOWO2_12_FULL_39_28]